MAQQVLASHAAPQLSIMDTAQQRLEELVYRQRLRRKLSWTVTAAMTYAVMVPVAPITSKTTPLRALHILSGMPLKYVRLMAVRSEDQTCHMTLHYACIVTSLLRCCVHSANWPSLCLHIAWTLFRYVALTLCTSDACSLPVPVYCLHIWYDVLCFCVMHLRQFVPTCGYTMLPCLC